MRGTTALRYSAKATRSMMSISTIKYAATCKLNQESRKSGKKIYRDPPIAELSKVSQAEQVFVWSLVTERITCRCAVDLWRRVREFVSGGGDASSCSRFCAGYLAA